MKLFRVRIGKVLHWPPEIEKKDILWLGPGGVLDLSDEFTLRCAAGQEYKLEPDEEATAPTPVINGRFMALREAYMNVGKPQVESNASPFANEVAKDIPKPDPRPKKLEEKKHGALSGAVSQGNPR